MDELGSGQFCKDFNEGTRRQVSRASNLRTLAFVSHISQWLRRCEPKNSGLRSQVAVDAIQLTTSIWHNWVLLQARKPPCAHRATNRGVLTGLSGCSLTETLPSHARLLRTHDNTEGLACASCTPDCFNTEF